jgi:signal transduction histidine kinase
MGVGGTSGVPTILAAGAPARLAPYLAFVAACYLAAPYLGLTSFVVDPRIAEVWPVGSVAFVGLTLVWSGGRRLLVGGLAGVVVVFAVTALVLGHPLGATAWWAVAGTGQAILMTWLYRRLLPHPGWAPETTRDLIALVVAAVVSSLACGLVGGFPHLGPGQVSALLLWWTLRNTVYCFVGGATFLLIFYWRRHDVLQRTPVLNLAALLVVTAVCIYGAYHDPKLPLSWLLLVPSVWGGLTLSPRGAAYLGLALSVGAAAMSLLPQNHFGYRGLLPPASIIDLLVAAGTAFLLLLALMRDQRGRLIEELGRRGAAAETQRRMLELVFNSVDDGVMIADKAGISMFNQPARRLLRQSIPRKSPDSWVETFHVRDADGNAVTDDDLRQLLADGAEQERGHELLVGQGDSARLLQVMSRPLPGAEDGTVLVLIHDVTSERARTRELMEFAGIVAHDLRGPLTGLEGWLELLEDGRQSGDRELADRSLDRARDASRRMRRVVDDWLSYTVVRDGALHPEPVSLVEVAREITNGHQGCGDAAPEFELDVTHTVQADPVLVRQLIDNLVGNAVKYTELGEVPRIVIRSRADAEDGWVRIDVVDDGIGIPAGEEELIFKEFHRGPDQGRSHGTGLGLALTRRIVLRHGGRMSATRNRDGGSTFTFTLPAA